MPVTEPVRAPGPPLSGAPTPAPGGALPGPSPSSGAPYSTTNVQEPGVDEPDIVKTNGATIFSVSQGKLYAVAVAGGSPRLVGSLDLGSFGYGSQLLLSGSKVIVISGQSPTGPLPARTAPALTYGSPYYYGGQTTLSEVDVSDPASMKITATLTVGGGFVDARQNGTTARIVISSAPRAIAYPALRGRASGYLASWRFHNLRSGRRFTGLVARCRDVAHPALFSGLGTVSILTVDLNDGLSAISTDTLMADAQVVYGSQGSVYVATERWIAPTTPAARLPVSQVTQIDRFDASAPDRTTLIATGDVPGYLLNQFSLSESGGYLRVATTRSPSWWEGAVPQVQSESYVTVLATSGSQLVPVGQLSGLGRGQRIYSVRFVGDMGYVVTFRQVDPLYTIDLSTPTAPRVTGQLELEGYSAYLHPLGGGLLLGVGNDVSSGNEPSRAQLEVFDVSDATMPKLIQKTTLGQSSSSQVQYDHHAFLFWAPTQLAVVPVETYPMYTGPPTPAPTPGSSRNGSAGLAQPTQDPSGTFIGAIAFHIDRSGITEKGRISHPATNGYPPPISRSIVIGDELYTLSDEGILASRLDTLAPIEFASFPAPAPPPIGSVRPAAR